MAQKKKNEPKNNSFHTLNYLMKIDQSIRNGEYPNANKLNKILGTQFSRSTFGRYIRTLQDDYGAPVEFDFKKNGYYCFLHKGKTGTLSILNGGTFKKLMHKNEQYY